MVQVEEHDCDYCDEIGGIKTVRNQASMPINGRVRALTGVFTASFQPLTLAAFAQWQVAVGIRRCMDALT